MSPIICMSHVSYHMYESCLLSYVSVMSPKDVVTNDYHADLGEWTSAGALSIACYFFAAVVSIVLSRA